MDEQEIIEVYAILLWAEKLANTYGLGINTIVDSFIKARAETGSTEKAQEFIENEMKSLRRRTDE